MSRRSCDSPEAPRPGKCGWARSQVSTAKGWVPLGQTRRNSARPQEGPLDSTRAESRAGPTTAPGQALLLCVSRVYWSSATRSSAPGRGPRSGSRVEASSCHGHRMARKAVHI